MLAAELAMLRDDANPGATAPGLRFGLHTALDHLGSHLELLKLESANELTRLGKVLGLWAGLIVTLQMAVVLTGFTAIAWLWDTPYRLLAIGLTFGALLLIAVVIWLKLKALARTAPLRFAISTQQWQRDVALVKELL